MRAQRQQDGAIFRSMSTALTMEPSHPPRADFYGPRGYGGPVFYGGNLGYFSSSYGQPPPPPPPFGQPRGGGLGAKGGIGKRRWRGKGPGPGYVDSAPPVQPAQQAAHPRPRKRSRKHHGEPQWRQHLASSPRGAQRPYAPLMPARHALCSSPFWWLGPQGQGRTPRTVPPAPLNTSGFLAPGKLADSRDIFAASWFLLVRISARGPVLIISNLALLPPALQPPALFLPR